MATFAIGDLHGNRPALERLLDTIRFDPARDRLWFVGDLVNRGPDSLGCLRFVRSLREAATVTLGNHDLALLVQASQPNADHGVNPSLAPVFAAADGAELMAWLRHRPLIHTDAALGWTMVHAGIPAQWNIEEAHARASELEHALRGPGYGALLSALFGDTPERWSASLTGYDRLRYITNALTRQRFVHPDGGLDMTCKAILDDAPPPLAPWFTLPGRRSADQRIVFGHWAALEPVAWPAHHVWCIDTGAAWGGRLTALRLDGAPQTVSVPA